MTEKTAREIINELSVEFNGHGIPEESLVTAGLTKGARAGREAVLREVVEREHSCMNTAHHWQTDVCSISLKAIPADWCAFCWATAQLEGEDAKS